MELRRTLIGRHPRHSSLPSFRTVGVAGAFPWQHTIPQRLPWATSTGLTEFTANERDRGMSRGVKSKRRSDKPESAPVSKQCLTEEMMAAHFTSLSLNNDHAYTSSGFPAAPPLARRTECAPPEAGRSNCSEPDGPRPLEDLLKAQYEHYRETEERLEVCECVIEDDLAGDAEAGGLPRLSLSPALQEGSLGISRAVPSEFIYSLYPSCSELVLWKPPGSFIPEVIRSLSQLEAQNQSQDQLRSPDENSPVTSEPPPDPQPDGGGQQPKPSDDMDLS
ncbi:uncharacterized protein [Lepisosteus oculatus]|uniref:uncharacterized protein n=1 Tax=Lepisosteus oculatus TaxID=7918 RepID=UPI00371BB1F9